MEKFTQELVTGVEEIDEQHRAIFKVFNELHDAINNPGKEANLERVFSYLKDYVVSHFSLEEEYMVKYAYPAYDFHKAQHEEFIEQLDKKQHDFLTRGESIKSDILVWLYFWFKKHILSVDKNMGEYFQKEKEKPPGE